MGRSIFLKNRKYETRKESPIIAIFANGKETEKNYFEALCKKLRLTSVRYEPNLVAVVGNEFHTKSLVDYAKENKGNAEEVWVVFDKDDKDDLFDKAIVLAKKEGMQVAYSNVCFELWFILHLADYGKQETPQRYCDYLTKLLGKKYEKYLDVYELIKGKEDDAIRRAQQLETQHDKDGVSTAHGRNPSTTVHLLVLRLRELSSEKR